MVWVILSFPAVSQVAFEKFISGEYMVIDRYDKEDGYYIFAPSNPAEWKEEPVVFVHGYGALNPKIYGGWLRHLLDQGYVVIYPRYQQGLLSTSAEDFVPFTTRAIRDALQVVRDHNRLLGKTMYLIGHSYGGVIVANLAATWTDWNLPAPEVALLCEPGSGPLRGGVLGSYERISPNTRLMIVVGNDDYTVGQKFGEFVFNSAVNTPARALLWQFASQNDTLEVTASHYEPYSLDAAFDNGIENFTSKRATRLARTDWVDREGYWKVFDMLVARNPSRASQAFSGEELDAFAHLGVWPDNTPLRRMDYRIPSPVADEHLNK